MLKETGTVLSVDADGLWVETLRQSSCAQCSAQKGCGQKVLADSVTKNMSHIKAFFSGEQERIWVRGDEVEIGVSEDMLVLATLAVYMVPLVLMVLFAYMGSTLGEGDAFSMAGATIGLLGGGLWSRWHSFRNRSNCRYHAVVLGSAK